MGHRARVGRSKRATTTPTGEHEKRGQENNLLNLDPKPLHLRIERWPVDTEDFRRALFVAAGALQRLDQSLALHRFQRGGGRTRRAVDGTVEGRHLDFLRQKF